MIKQMLKKINFNVEMKLMRGYEKGVRCQNELVKWLIQQCNKEAEQAREEGVAKNIKCFGRHSLMKDRIVQMRDIERTIHTIDSKEEEIKQA